MIGISTNRYPGMRIQSLLGSVTILPKAYFTSDLQDNILLWNQVPQSLPRVDRRPNKLCCYWSIRWPKSYYLFLFFDLLLWKKKKRKEDLASKCRIYSDCCASHHHHGKGYYLCYNYCSCLIITWDSFFFSLALLCPCWPCHRPRTTDAQRGNSLHCTAETSLPLPNF